MRKFFAVFLIICAMNIVCACESNTTVDKMQSTQDAATQELASFRIGEDVFIKNNDGEYKFTITGVEETSERNEFAEKSPNRVIVISYSYENISKSDELYIGDINFKAYDKENNSMDTYPVVLDVYPDAISTGRKSSAKVAYGLDSADNYVELEFYDNMFMDADCKIILEW